MPRSTRLSLFPDINVWVALTHQSHVHHEVARTWFEALESGAQLFFCRITKLGFLRLLTSETVMGREVMDQTEAWRAYDRLLENEQIAFLEEPAELEVMFRSLSKLPHPASKDWADSYIAAFAETSRVTLVTFDRAFKSKIMSVVVLDS